MKRPAVFFDRDNTLIVSDGYLGDPAKVVLVGGAADAVARARALGYAVVVFSNQSGVARGMFSEEDVQAVNARTDELLATENPTAIVDRHEFCPFHPDGTIDVYARESDRRKPKPGMILAAAEKLAIDLPRSWVVGDAGRDVEAGRAAGCRAILFSDPALKKSPAAEGRPAVEADYVVSTLTEAMDFIERNRETNGTGMKIAVASTQKDVAVTETPPPSLVVPAVMPVTVSPNPAPTKEAAPAAAVENAPRVPKVAIGSKYVAPAGKEAVAPASRADTADRPAPRKAAPRATEEDLRPAAAPPASGFERMETLLEQIFLELRRQHEHRESDFSVSKLLAGVVQVLVLAVMFFAYLKRDAGGVQTYLMVATLLQTLTISLLIMSRQK